MKFHAPSKHFIFTAKQIENASQSFPLEIADHAQLALIRAAKELGIDLGAEWGDELDVSKFEN